MYKWCCRPISSKSKQSYRIKQILRHAWMGVSIFNPPQVVRWPAVCLRFPWKNLQPSQKGLLITFVTFWKLVFRKGQNYKGDNLNYVPSILNYVPRNYSFALENLRLFLLSFYKKSPDLIYFITEMYEEVILCKNNKSSIISREVSKFSYFCWCK